MIEWYLGGKKITYKYDLNGRVIESIQWGKNNRIEIKTRYQYTDDKKDNWTEQKKYSNFPNSSNVNPDDWLEGEPEYREITYYE